MFKRLLHTSRAVLKSSEASSASGSSKAAAEQHQQHLELFKKYYSEDVINTIKITESVVEPQHYANRRLSNKFHPGYLDDLTTLNPVLDKVEGADPIESMTKPSPLELIKKATIKNSERARHIAKEVSLLTGLDERYLSKLHARPLVLKNVSNQTKKGKIQSYYALVAVGDKNGMIGIGEGKNRESMSNAIFKAHWQAVKNLKYVPRHENRTILTPIEDKFHAVKFHLKPASPGFGLRVNHYIFELCQLIGIKDLGGKVFRSRNGMNLVKGVVKALTEQKTLEEMSLRRGKKIIDVRKVYYSEEMH